jgi:hypothetical protein
MDRLRVGVDAGADPNAPSSLRNRPASASSGSPRKVARLMRSSDHSRQVIVITGATMFEKPPPTRASLGPDEIDEYALVVVSHVRQVVREVGKVVAAADLHVLADITIDCGQRAAALLIDIG